MKNFHFLYSFIILIFIYKVYSINDKECPEGLYGLNCEKNCTCNKWSSNGKCSRIAGNCLGCKFGHFGTDCNDICYPRCKTNLCCSILKNSEKKYKNIKLNISMLTIKVDNQELNILPDYNVGHNLTIFKKSLTKDLTLSNLVKSTETIKYTNYTVTGDLYLDNNISIIGIDGSDQIDLPLSIKLDENIDVQDINGVIGLGFLNSINDELFSKNIITDNIISYSFYDDNYINILFGYMFEEEKDFINKLSYCDISTQDDFGIISKVDGIRVKLYSDGLSINETTVNFAINEKSSFILNDNIEIKFYIKKYFFNDKSLNDKDKTFESKTDNYKEIKSDDNTTYFCFKKDLINNKLSDLGFIINDFYYSYEPKFFFVEEDKCTNDYMKFIIGFNDEKVGIVFGKDILKDTMFTIDNEEKKIYFYARNVEYFSGETFLSFIPSINLEPITISIIITSIIFSLNIISFLIYFFIKRKKEKIN